MRSQGVDLVQRVTAKVKEVKVKVSVNNCQWQKLSEIDPDIGKLVFCLDRILVCDESKFAEKIMLVMKAHPLYTLHNLCFKTFIF